MPYPSYDLYKLSDTQSILMYHSVVKVFKNCRLEFFKMKLQSSICNDLFICFHKVYETSELFNKKMNAQKESMKKNFWGSHKLPQAHKKYAMKMKETNKINKRRV